MNNTQSTELIFDISKSGRRCHRLPACDVPTKPAAELLPKKYLADRPPPLPEVGEIETEGLGIMAADMGLECWGLPLLEIRHR